MTVQLTTVDEWFEPFDIRRPARQTVAAVYASPHSGTNYTKRFLRQSRLDPLTLRRSEDSFVDEIFAAAPDHGAPLLRALFPRAFVDPNREPYELDPSMFQEPLPDFANSRSPRVAAGLGTVARIVANGEQIYDARLPVSDAMHRIERYYQPYHDALAALIAQTKDSFGKCVLIDCHSMPSTGGPMERDAGRQRVDFVLGDCHGTACAPSLIQTVGETLRALGYTVVNNVPYAGGHTTRHYGKPDQDVHALQIEINRALYMDEERIERRPGIARLAEDMAAVMKAVSKLVAGSLR